MNSSTTNSMEDPTELASILDHFERGDYAKVLASCGTDSLPTDLYWHALVETQDYDKASSASENPQQKLYVEYKRKHYKAVLKASTSDSFGTALVAQALYHSGDYKQASSLFFELARTTDDPVEAMRAWTNGIACWTADASTHSLAGMEDATVSEVLAFLETYDDETEPPYELQYTLASFLMLVQPNIRWMKILEMSKDSCDDDEDLELIETNFDHVFGSKQDSDTTNPIRLANVDPLLLQAPPKEWTPRQKLTFTYNQALAKKLRGKDYAQECSELASKPPFWQVRALILQDDTVSIENFIESCPDMDSKLLATFHLANRSEDPSGFLEENLPKNILQKPALQALSTSSGNMVEAYERNKNASEASFARWIRALSYENPKRALAEWRKHDSQSKNLMSNFDPQELENRERPRSLPTLARSAVDAIQASKSKKKKSKEAVLRYRAKKRSQYLERKGIPEHRTPSLNRWLSQKQTAQGAVGVSSAKFDVANRQATANSTAHLGVKGRSKKGKRR